MNNVLKYFWKCTVLNPKQRNTTDITNCFEVIQSKGYLFNLINSFDCKILLSQYFIVESERDGFTIGNIH